MTRNASGESSITGPDAAGRYHGWVSLGTKGDGKRDRRHVSSTRRADVVKKVRELERRRDAGAVAAAGRTPTVAAWLDHWVTVIAPRRCRWKTLAWYETVIRLHIGPNIGHHRLDRLEPDHLESLYVHLERRGKSAAVVEAARQAAEAARREGNAARIEKARAALSMAEAAHKREPQPLAPSSVLQVHRIVSRALKVAVQREKIARNVATLVDAPSLSPQPVAPLTEHEARRLLAAAEGERNGVRWSLALALGVRQGEALGLRWSDVRLDDVDAPDDLAGVLTITSQLQRQTGRGLVFVEVKSDAGNREIPLPRPLRDALRSHRAAQAAERLAAGSEWRDYDLVFCQLNGKPIDPRRDLTAWKALLARAGIRDARLHDARHTAATLLVAMGVHPRVAMAILGHGSLSQTQRYMHSTSALAQDATDRVGAALWGESGASR